MPRRLVQERPSIGVAGERPAPSGLQEAYAHSKRTCNRTARQVSGCLLVTLALLVWITGRAAAEPITIVALGDSLTAGFQLPPRAAFPVRLEAALRSRGHDVTVQNAGVSGDTTAAGLARLDWAVGPEADAVIVELGGNDALRGLAPDVTRANLDALLGRLNERNLPILLAGMLSPRNLGAEYATAFDAVYPELAEKHGTLFYPFFLDGVATDPALNLDDGIHPNEAGVDVIVERILPTVEALIERARAGSAG